MDLDINIQKLTKDQGAGDTSTAYNNILAGKNWMGGPIAHVPIQDKTGLVFLTRPDLNLADDNIGHQRYMTPLLTRNPKSLGSAIRALMDPRASRDGGCMSDLINPEYPFFTLLDNTVTSLTGWPDYVLNKYSSETMNGGSVLISPEGEIARGQAFDLSVTHTNVDGDAINQTYTFLQNYMDLVMKDKIRPYNDNVINDRYDFAMRWYRFSFDSTGTRVNQFTMCGYCFPVAASQGAAMNYTTASPENEGYSEVSTTWACMGVFHNDPIVIDEFNRAVVAHQSNMEDSIREDKMVLIGDLMKDGESVTSVPSMIVVGPYQYYGYPRINPDTLIFEIWLMPKEYEYISNPEDGDEVVAAVKVQADQDFNAKLESMTDEQKAVIFGEA